jgi:hypothetical protein
MALSTCAGQYYSWGTNQQSITMSLTPVPSVPGSFVINHNVTPNAYLRLYVCASEQSLVMACPASGSTISGLPSGTCEAQIVQSDVYFEVVNCSNIVYFSNSGSPPAPSPPSPNPNSNFVGSIGGQANLIGNPQSGQTSGPVLIQFYRDLETAPFQQTYIDPTQRQRRIRISPISQPRSIQARISTVSSTAGLDLSRAEIYVLGQRRAGP